MDHLDNMICEALSETYEPDSSLAEETARKMYLSQKENKIIINLIFILNLMGIMAVNLLLILLSSNLRILVYFCLLIWISVVVPIYLLARDMISKHNKEVFL